MTCQAGKHGTVSAANRGCVCPDARQAKYRQEKKRQLLVAQLGHGLWVDSTGTARRLRALMALGHSTWKIADAMGTSQQHVRRLLRGEGRVHVVTAAKARAAYDALGMTRGDGPRVKRTLDHAARMGWPPPLAWDDETIDDPAAGPWRDTPVACCVDDVAVERFLSGDPVKLTRPERAEAARRAVERLGYDQAQRLLKCSGSTLHRMLEQARSQGAA